MTAEKSDFLKKVEGLRKLMAQKGSQAVMLEKQMNFSWLTGGRGFVGLASEGSCGSILVTADKVYLIANNVEAPRLSNEEIGGLVDLIEVKSHMWHRFQDRAPLIKDILGDGKYITDGELGVDMRNLRSRLSPLDIERYALLSLQSAVVVEDVCKNIKPGVSEFEVAGEVSGRIWAQGIEPITVMVAFDDRLMKYRHPIPTGTRLKKYAMVVACTRKYGLVTSLTRLVSLGAIDPEIRKKHNAVAEIDACFIANTRPGAVAADIFDKAVATYKSEGYGSEWELHHQGGMAGFNAREYIANSACREVVELNQAFAWNPSIAGTKSEDTIVVEEKGNRILSHTGSYPYIETQYGGQKLLRPDMLVL